MTALYEVEIEDKAEFWAYFSHYDWVVFCQLFGGMENLPIGINKYCNDLKGLMNFSGLDKAWQKEYCPKPAIGQHHALVDAHWDQQLFETIQNWKE